MESRGPSGGIVQDIGRGGARESSRQSGRIAEKAAACQSARGSLPNSASPPPTLLPQQPPAPAKGGRHDCAPACRLSVLPVAAAEFVTAPSPRPHCACPHAIWPRPASTSAQAELRALSLVEPRVIRRACTASSIADVCLEHHSTPSLPFCEPAAAIATRTLPPHCPALANSSHTMSGTDQGEA